MEAILFKIAIISGIIFLIQTALGFIGLDTDLDTDTGEGFFTIRNLITFVLGVSTGGYLALRNGYSESIGVLVGVVFGLILVAATFIGMRTMYRLQQVNKIEDKDYEGKEAQVTIEIPAKGKGLGKVTFVLHGRNEEKDVITEEKENLHRNAQVVIVKLLENNALLVKKII